MPKTVDDLYEEAYPDGPRLDSSLRGAVTRVPEGHAAGKAFPPAADTLSHPQHYNVHPSGIETIDLVKHESFLRGNILKYVLRAPYKGHEMDDLQKAREYLDLEIARVRGEESNGATHR